ncbi:MAG: tRNA pseudouridine(55) synthase TruB [Clostridiales bacterium]|nr:tRNA pseudouridine(55) synthase TruB [Clostridiales bacterium]
MNKPVGLTSFRVVSLVRKLTGVKKVGHTGTLDPFATGVLPICVGKATRLIRYLENDDKEYRCTIRFGSFSDTQDSEGVLYGGRRPNPEELEAMRNDDYRNLRKRFEELQGSLVQTPPIYSAVKVNGKKAYEYARKGIPIELKPRTVQIYSCRVLNISSEPELEAEFVIHCSKGTYIRAICEELGKKSGFGAYALQLRRTRSGAFGIDDAYLPEEAEQAYKDGNLESLFISEEICVRHLPAVEITEEEAEHIRNGRLLPLSDFSGRIDGVGKETGQEAPRLRAMRNEKLIAIVYPSYTEGHGILRIERMLDEF